MPATDRHDHARSSLRISRRALLAGMAATGLAACFRGTGTGTPTVSGVADPVPFPGIVPGLFSLGVASGDPTPDGFVLWTRLAPQPLETGGGMPTGAVHVRWQVARDAAFTQLVADGVVITNQTVAHSVHVEMTGLPADQSYHYRFTTGGQVSPTGRTRTAPAADADVTQLRLAFATCQHYEQGYYTAWKRIAEDQPDLVVFLGDYIYEGGISTNRYRRHNSPECTTLDAYRKRYGLYKRDPHLQAAHAAAPWVVTWDDHEVENNYAGIVPQDAADAAGFAERRTGAYQAYWEHQPLRGDPANGPWQIYRSLTWGRLADLVVLDGRQYRSDQECGPSALGADIGPACEARDDPSRTMLGADQLAWLADTLEGGQGRWTLLANQTILTSMPLGTVFNQDQWDGYPLEQAVVIEGLGAVRNAVVLTGDMHVAGVGLVGGGAGGPGVVGTELIATSISSTPNATEAAVLQQVAGALPQFPWFNALQRGYCRATITPGAFDVDFVTVDASTDGLAPAVLDSAWRIADGTPGITAR